MDVLSYPDWPAVEFRLRVTWNEERRRLKLRVPTRFGASVLCEVPGAAVRRTADGEEHVHGRWLLVEGRAGGRAAALGVVNSGQPGYDLEGGEVRLSVLRSSAYCHEQGFDLGHPGRARQFSDIGIHDVRLLVAAGEPDDVKALLPGLADYLTAPPAAYAHLPFGLAAPEEGAKMLLSLSPANIRLLACKPSWDGRALVVRVRETTGSKTRGSLDVAMPKTRGHVDKRGHVQRVRVPLSLRAFEVKTVRVETDGTWREVSLIEETPA